MFDVVTFGECMLRLSMPGGLMLEQAERLRADPAGTESNVAVALARLGVRVAWLSALPDNSIGRWIAGRLEAHGVDISRVVWTQDRAGAFFLEAGLPPRGSRVVYDRARSAVSRMTPEMVDWPFVTDARLIHLSGITPALSETCRDIVVRALMAAKAQGCLTSFDVNYRAKLWSPDQAATVLEPILGQVEILISTVSDIRLLFGHDGSPDEIMDQLRARFHNRMIVLTLAEGGAVGWSEDTGLLRTEGYPVEQVDRLGAGDAFDAGLLFGILRGDFALGLSYGAALAALSYSEQGDVTWSAAAEVIRLVQR